jgi:hypothetical protein|nr:MAG TPA: tail protein [Caudoviricetes sp.]
MINHIKVTNHLGQSLLMDMKNPYNVGLAITNCDGLGPVKSDINTTILATSDGARYNSATVGVRNITLTLQHLWVSTVPEARKRTYKYFPIKKKIILTINTDHGEYQTSGYVESNDVYIWGTKPRSSISILCTNPYFYSTSGMDDITSFSNIQPLFEFPFENNSLTEPMLEFSSSTSITEKNIDYRGDAEIGMFMTLQFTGIVKNITIHNITLDQHMKIDTKRLKPVVGTEYFKAGDEVTINTITGEKFIYLQRDGETKSILACLDKNTDWINLVSGDNHFAYVAESGIEFINFQIKHLLYYQGI